MKIDPKISETWKQICEETDYPKIAFVMQKTGNENKVLFSAAESNSDALYDRLKAYLNKNPDVAEYPVTFSQRKLDGINILLIHLEAT